MTNMEHIKRVIELKRQAVFLIQNEVHELEEIFALNRMLARFEKKIDSDFDPIISQKIDIIRTLLGD